MLMPILSARTPAQTAPVVPVEASQPVGRLAGAMLSISGPRAEAILKILETLGRHLNGSEVLPKEALVKLMETLARILKFPPLPQETIHDFGQRLAGFLEKLPPEARIVVEKQLGQRNLALQVRLLAEVLNSPAGTDAGRLRATLQNPAVLSGPSRDTAQQVRSSLPQPALPAQHLATLTAGSAPVMFAAAAEPALLQAVLRKTFGSDAQQAVSEHDLANDTLEAETTATPRRSSETPVKTGQAAQTGHGATTRPAASEPLPQLRATAAFLAGDPEALSLVSAIAQGEIDPQIEMTFAPQPEDKMPLKPNAAPVDVEAESVASPEMDAEAAVADMEQAEPAPRDEVLPKPTNDIDGQPLTDVSDTDRPVSSMGGTDQAQDAPPLDDRSVMDDRSRAKSVEQRQEEKPQSIPDRQPEKPTRILAETLKALVQNTLPLPEATPWEMTGLSRQPMPGSAVDPVAVLLPVEASGLEAMLEAASTESDAGWTAELSDEIDSWVAQADAGPEELAEGHAAWAPLPKADETIRDPLLQHRLLEGMVGRDAIPFAIIPYLPAKMEDGLFAEPAEEEQPASAGEEEAGDQTQDEGQSESGDEAQTGSSAEPDAIAGDDDETAQDAYALYMRMGGLG